MLDIKKEASRCLLCDNAACTSACTNGMDPAGAIRSVYFDNGRRASSLIDSSVCIRCEGSCEYACIHYDMPIRIRELANNLPEKKPAPSVSLRTSFMGVSLENPFLLSSSIVAGSYEMCKRAFELGWAGAAFKTIGFLIPKEVSPRFDAISKDSVPFVGFRNLEQISDRELSQNLSDIKRLKQEFPSKVIIASIMGQDEDEWTRLASLVTEAGADIIECNFSCPQMCGSGLGSDVGENPELVAAYTVATRKGTSLPILAKMTPNLGKMEPPAIAAIKAGADGIAAINTVKSITGLSYDCRSASLEIEGLSAVSGYSGKAVKPIALRFISDLSHCGELKGIPISGMGGIETWHDAAEFMALGCGCVQITTAVMQYGYRIIDDLVSGLSEFLEESGYKSVSELIGSAVNSIVEADRLERSSTVYPSFDAKRCVGCARCALSCQDAGHQAITLCGSPMARPRLDPKKCVGCHLCRLVCPTGAIGSSKRIYNKA